MKKKILIIILLMFIFTGCKVNYELEITDVSFNEVFDASEKDMEKANSEVYNGSSFRKVVSSYAEKEILTNYYELLSQEQCTNNCNYYLKETVDNSSEVAIILSANHTYDEYKESSILNNYLSSAKVEKEGTKVRVLYTGYWTIIDTYKTLDEINITIKTDYIVESNNADSVDGNKYTWKITKEDKDKTIDITIDTEKKQEEVDREESEANSKRIIIISLVLVLLLLIGLLISYTLYKKNNDVNRL